VRLKVSKSQNSETLYMIRSIYRDGKNTSEVVERLGSPIEISLKHPGRDPYEWAREYIAKKTAEEQTKRRKITENYNPARRLVKNERQHFFGGYLFLQQVFNELDFPAICTKVATRHNLRYKLSDILLCLLYTQLFEPSIKPVNNEFLRGFIEPLSVQPQQVQQVLKVLETESDLILTAFNESSGVVPKDSQDTPNGLIETLALILLRILEERLKGKFSHAQILDGLKSLYFLKTRRGDFIPVYTRTDFTDALHDAFGFTTDNEIIEYHEMQRIIRKTRKQPPR